MEELQGRFELDLHSLTEPKRIIDEMYRIKMEIDRTGKEYGELDRKKNDFAGEFLGSMNFKESSDAIHKVSMQQLEIDRYQKVLKLIYLTLDKLFLIDVNI